MSWANLDDGFAEHPKMVDIDDASFRLHVAAMCACARRGTDGFIKARDLRSLRGLVHGKPSVDDLVKAGLWEVAEGGWLIHDWLKHNKPASKVREERDMNKARQTAFREQKKAERNALRNGPDNALRNGVRTGALSYPILSSESKDSDPPKSPKGTDRDLPAKVKTDPEDLGINAWNAIQEAAGGPQALGLDRCYGSDVSCWLEDSRLSAWILTWKRFRELVRPHTLADCKRLGQWIAAGGAGKLTPWQVLAKPGNHANAGDWFNLALRWDGISDPRQRNPPRAPAGEAPAAVPKAAPPPEPERQVDRLIRERKEAIARGEEPPDLGPPPGYFEEVKKSMGIKS